MTAVAAAPTDLTAAAVRVLGLAVLALAVAAVGGLLHRWYARTRIPEGLAVLLGLGAVAIWLNSRETLRQFLGGGVEVLDPQLAAVNVVAFLGAALAGGVGGRLGDRLGVDATALVGRRELDADVGRLVRSVGRVIAVTLPEDVEDVDGHDPLPAEKKAALAGTRLVFPRGLTVSELRERLTTRLREDYGVGRVEVELTEEGTVERLALGGRVARLGPTLAPGTVAVAVRADPAFAASPGDVVQVWQPADEGWERVVTAELRAAVEDVVTLVVSEADRSRLDPDVEYRLLTLPTEPRFEREFAAVVRAADETMEPVTLAPDSPLVGLPVGALAPVVVAVRTADGTVRTLPPRDRLLAAGETCHVLGSRADLRAVAAAAADPDDATSL